MTVTPLPLMNNQVPAVRKGLCYILFAFEIGQSVNLELASQRIKLGTERMKFRRNRKAPTYFDYDPPPLRISQHGQQINVGRYFTKSQTDITLFDFGACSVCYELDLNGPMSYLVELSDVLYDNSFLLNDARERVAQILSDLGSAVGKPEMSDAVEDFTVYHIEEFETPVMVDRLLNDSAKIFAQVLRAETEDLSLEEIRDAISARTSYNTGDCTIVDWNAAFVFGTSVEDSVAVLEFCNVELLEMRVLDELLDDHLERAYNVLTTGKKGGDDLRKVARLQVDTAILYEAVENALKLLGDQYLARLYTSASTRFHLQEWHSSIRRKLDTLDSIYQKLSDQAAQKRSEFLEIIIIGLILVEIVMGLMPTLG